MSGVINVGLEKKLDLWIKQCNDEFVTLSKSGSKSVQIEALKSQAMSKAYKNVKYFIKVNSKTK